MIITIITFIIVFGILVLVHEFGHYYFAKRAGILVREFSIGMGPKIWWKQSGGTTYTIRILPLGGYVRLAGADDEDEDEDEDDDEEEEEAPKKKGKKVAKKKSKDDDDDDDDFDFE